MIYADDHYYISKIINEMLPPGLHYYGARAYSKDAYEVRFFDGDSLSYFHQVYELGAYPDKNAVLVAILKDTHKFIEQWNSPLMKALR